MNQKVTTYKSVFCFDFGRIFAALHVTKYEITTNHFQKRQNYVKIPEEFFIKIILNLDLGEKIPK